ncbi:MAG: hypothetical protein WEE67_08860 [Chloroflexota bacterium]
MKRREVRERDEALARDQAERRTEELLAKLKARESEARSPTEEDEAPPEPEDAPQPQDAPLPEDAPTVVTSKPSEGPR